MFEKLLGRRRLIDALQRGDVLAIRQLLRNGVNANTCDAQGTPALVVAANHSDPEAVRELLRSGGSTGFKDAVGTAITLGHAPVLEVLLEAGGLKCWWEEFDGRPIRAHYENPARKASLLEVVERAKRKQAGDRPAEMRKLWQEGPQDEIGRRVFTWLRGHTGSVVNVSRWFEEGNFHGDHWTRHTHSQPETGTWIVGSPDLGPRQSAFAKGDFTLRWWLWATSRYSQLEFELPMDTYQDAEIHENGVCYSWGTSIVTGDWKPSGDLGESAGRAARREDVGERVYFTFKLRH